MTNYSAEHWHTHRLKCGQCQEAYAGGLPARMCGTGMVFLLAAHVTGALWDDEHGNAMGAQVNSWHYAK